MSIQIGLRELNHRLVEVVKMVERGEEVMITRRGTIIAKFIPFSGESELDDAQVAALKRSRARMKKGFAYAQKVFHRDDLYE